MDKIRCQSPVPPQWLHLVLKNNLTKISFLYLVIDVAVLVLITLRRHMLLTLVGPRFLAVVQIGAVGVQRRLQISQQGICNNNNKSIGDIYIIITRPDATTTTTNERRAGSNKSLSLQI